MQFSDTTTKTGILQDIEQKVFGDKGYGRITGDTDLLYQFTNRVNRGLDRFYELAMTADGRWQWDDKNYTDTAIATTDIVSGQRIYIFAVEHLEIERVLIKDSSGIWRVIYPMDSRDDDQLEYIENNAGRTGLPTKYDKRGDAIYLDVTPDYNGDEALKIYFRRGASYFTYTDTDRVPGIPSPFHKFLSRYAETTYKLDRNINGAKNAFDLLQMEETEIKRYFSKRNRDEKQQITPYYLDNR